MAAPPAPGRQSAAQSVRPWWRRFERTLAGQFAEAFFRMRAIDRALALASKLFIALLPLSILITALVNGQSFGDELVDRFGLTGAGARAARSLFAAPEQVQAAVGVLGIVILVSSVHSLASAVQRLYLDCWNLRPDRRATQGRLLWLATLLVWVAVLSGAREALEEEHARALSWVVAGLGGGAFFLWTPYLMLGRRVPSRALIPTALWTGLAIAVLAVGSDLVMPDLVSHNTRRYGMVGLTFSLVSWLFSGAVLVVAGAIAGAIMRSQRPLRTGALPP